MFVGCAERPAEISEGERLSCEELAEREGIRRGLNPALMRAKARIESRNKKEAVSQAGALGCLQVMPSYWQHCASECGLKGPGDLLDPEKNVCCGGKHFAEDLRAQKNDVVRALQAYNGGPKCIGRCEESIKHARLVLASMATDIR